MSITYLLLHLGYGGTEKAAVDRANIMCQWYDVTIICTYKSAETPYKIDPRIKLKYLMEDISNRNEFWALLKKGKLIQTFFEGLKSTKILYLRKKLVKEEIKKIDKGIIISSRILYTKLLSKHGNKNVIKLAEEHRHHNGNKRYIKAVKRSCKNIDYYLPVSKELTDFYQKEFEDTKTKCKYIPHFLDYIPKELSKLEGYNIISVGRLSPEKGFLDLIDCFDKIQKQIPKSKLHIIGDGIEKKLIEDKIGKLNLSKKVKLYGFQNKNFINKTFQNMDLYLMTSFEESFGMVLLEAMSFGIPCIAFSSAQGANEIIGNDSDGYLIENRDKDIFSKTAIELLINKDKLRKLGINGRKKSLNYSKEKIAKEWHDFLEEIGEKNEKIL